MIVDRRPVDGQTKQGGVNVRLFVRLFVRCSHVESECLLTAHRFPLISLHSRVRRYVTIPGLARAQMGHLEVVEPGREADAL